MSQAPQYNQAVQHATVETAVKSSIAVKPAHLVHKRHSRVTEDAYRSAPFHIYIAHTDGSHNNTCIVFKWNGDKLRNASFRNCKRMLHNYNGTSIRWALFYYNDHTEEYYGKMDVRGVFHDGCAFMNRL